MVVGSGAEAGYIYNSIIVHASKEKIWDILIDVENWKSWDKDVKSAKLLAPFEVGAPGILVSIDNKKSTFIITDISKYNYYKNYYHFPLLTKLKFKHKIQELGNNKYKITFIAKFSGLLARYYTKKQSAGIKYVMNHAMINLLNICENKD